MKKQSRMYTKIMNLLFVLLCFCLSGCGPKLVPPSIDFTFEIHGVENGLSLPLDNIVLKISYGLYLDHNSHESDAIVRFQFESDELEYKYVFFEINDLNEKDYSYYLDGDGKAVCHCFADLYFPRDLFPHDSGKFYVGYGFFHEGLDTPSMGIGCDLKYEIVNENINIKKA